MALVLKDRVKETTTTTGTGSFALAGAVTGYDSFGQIGNGNTTYYAVYLDGGSEWEVGIGTYTAPSTLSRDTILASSNAGSVVTFSAGQKTIWCDYPAGKAVYTDATGSISQSIVNVSSITGYISSPDYVQFDTTYATALGVGQLGWDGNNTLAVGMAGGNVVQHIGEDQYFYIKASSAITKGQLIMFTGAVGASGVLTGAPSTGVTVPEYIMGIAAESIALNGFGLVQCFGELTNVNTNAFNEGDVLYYDSAVTGGLTNVYPSSGIIVTVAAVAKKSAGGGVLSIRLTETPRITASTGISVSQTNAGATITNTAPDQTVAIASGTGISVTGTYPNFTVSNTGVTSVTGTSPVVSSGGTTPAISIPAANGSTNGYLTSTDWTTFNNKAASFTYTTNYIPYGQGTTTPTQSANLTFNGTTLTTTGISDSGNLTFTGTGNRITGDFSNATIANRVAFQSSTTNGVTNLIVIPNGTATTGGYLAFNNSDITNSSLLAIQALSGEARINPTITGTGTYVPITMYTNGSERLRIDTSGNLLVGITSARANAGDVQVSKGISFPATQSAQSDANTLDDYEEGTWTPVMTAASGSLTAYTSSGRYTKVGNTVYVSGTFTITTAGTAAAYAIVNGYPFTSNSAQTFNGSCREAVFTGNIYIAQIGASATSGIIGGNANGAIVWTNNYRYDWNFTYQV